MTIVIVWVDLGIPILTKHVFVIAFISIARDSHTVRNHSMCSEAPQYDLGTKILHALKLSNFFQLNRLLELQNNKNGTILQASFCVPYDFTIVYCKHIFR